MPTINQLVRKGRKPKPKKSTAPALQYTFNTFKQRRTRQPNGRAAEAWCVHPGADDDPEETELGAA